MTLHARYEELLRLRLKVALAELQHAKGNLVRANAALAFTGGLKRCITPSKPTKKR